MEGRVVRFEDEAESSNVIDIPKQNIFYEIEKQNNLIYDSYEANKQKLYFQNINKRLCESKELNIVYEDMIIERDEEIEKQKEIINNFNKDKPLTEEEEKDVYKNSKIIDVTKITQLSTSKCKQLRKEVETRLAALRRLTKDI